LPLLVRETDSFQPLSTLPLVLFPIPF